MLARFEQLVQQAVEGSVRRVFPTTLQPVQLARTAARAMEQAQLIGVHGPQVPNAYVLRLAPADLARFADYSVALSNELGGYLAEYARERGLRPIAEPRVELVADARTRVGTVAAEARYVDVAPSQKTELEAAVHATRQLLRADLESARASVASEPATPDATLWLIDPLAEPFALEPQVGMVRLGRGADNDLVVRHQRVSRYHAQLRLVESSWLVYDLDSTNGTWVDQHRVLPARPSELTPGAVLRLGDYELRASRQLPPAPRSE